MKRKLQWAVFQIVFYALMYYALIAEIIGAQRLLVFVVWFYFLWSSFVFSEKFRKHLRAAGRSVPAWMSRVAHYPKVILFVYFGWWLTGIVYFLHLIFMGYAFADDSGEESKE